MLRRGHGPMVPVFAVWLMRAIGIDCESPAEKRKENVKFQMVANDLA